MKYLLEKTINPNVMRRGIPTSGAKWIPASGTLLRICISKGGNLVAESMSDKLHTESVRIVEEASNPK
ncbi:MAG: hypothetical protein GTO63_20405 [Anaerolineae bacterium]|nr:hypothetical protein [Anaerolineae bacterium]NIN97136.1 hypothetical protein [Anaerolineae bacterium]NIQ80109.1 hypothetical protein [Anaerolineae bacterium]